MRILRIHTAHSKWTWPLDENGRAVIETREVSYTEDPWTVIARTINNAVEPIESIAVWDDEARENVVLLRPSLSWNSIQIAKTRNRE